MSTPDAAVYTTTVTENNVSSAGPTIYAISNDLWFGNFEVSRKKTLIFTM